MTRSSKDAGQVRTHSHRQKRTHWTHTVLGTESEVESWQPHDPYPDQGIAEMDGKPTTQGRRDIRSPLEQECSLKGTVKGLLEATAYEGKDVPWGQWEKLLPQTAMFSNSARWCAWVALTGSALPVTAEAVICQTGGKRQLAGGLLRGCR